ncbi:MAG TPA: 3-oxo-tetronate kinase [Candidatus Limnocylindrales bacterium]|nr:3-oxo-tetronate kinase [Candidatus Limnocylindrales bacterium]
MPRNRIPILGCIADDLTGATDLAGGLVREGLRVTVHVGVPGDDLGTPAADAVVVALKSRSIRAADAVVQARRSLAWLRSIGIERHYFKYASTFDSTPTGNIGPVTEALQADLEASLTVACPAFPANGRTVYQGHLFVGELLLSESPMRHHPLNPMTDSSVVRLLAAQATGSVGLVPYAIVEAGPGAIRDALEALAKAGTRHAVADALDEGHLASIAEAVVDAPLVTGGSALAAAIGAVLRERDDVRRAEPPTAPGRADGRSAVIAGSCSAATLGQVAAMAARRPALTIDAEAAARGEDVAAAALDWAARRLPDGPVLISTSAPPHAVESFRATHGPDGGAAIERQLATIACGLVELGVRRLVVAGGETSGAVVEALGVRQLDVGREIEPGVPWVVAREPVEIGLVLKSGNFGSVDFFARALGETP